jgi:predicted alpha/beta hydrolase family esterase
MSKFLILHGTDGSPKSNWFMWLKGILVGQGHAVWLPQLPDAAAPNAKTYTDFLLSNSDFTFDEDTIIIGHSSGAVEALHLLQHLPDGATIKASILVSAFKDDLGWDSLKGLFVEPLDFDTIKSHCANFTFIHSDDDPYCPLEHAEYLTLKTGGELIVFEGQGHFNTELGPQYKQFPEILDFISELE